MGRGKIFINGHILFCFFFGFFSFSFFFCYYQKNDNFSTSNNGFARNTSNLNLKEISQIYLNTKYYLLEILQIHKYPGHQ